MEPHKGPFITSPDDIVDVVVDILGLQRSVETPARCTRTPLDPAGRTVVEEQELRQDGRQRPLCPQCAREDCPWLGASAGGTALLECFVAYWITELQRGWRLGRVSLCAPRRTFCEGSAEPAPLLALLPTHCPPRLLPKGGSSR